jgi:hypothetical protein
LTSEKTENVAVVLGKMDLQYSNYSGVDVAGFRVGGIININWEATAGNIDDRCLVEEL